MKKNFIAWVLFFITSSTLAQQDLVDGNLIQFNDNGTWSWYQDERAIVDVANGRIFVGSDADSSGVGGSPRDADIEAAVFDLQTGRSQRYVLMEGGSNFGGSDDHNAPAFLVRPDGNVLAMYAGHNNNYFSYYRVFNGSSWGSEGAFNWANIPGGSDFPTTYSNLWHMSSENKIYNFARSYARSPNMMVSTDQGNSWTYGGLLTEPDANVGYVNGYFKYSGNGVDRIDFVATEHHPRDFNTSIYHGYVMNGQSFNSFGSLMDSDITDKSAPLPADFSLVFAANTVVNGITMTRAWTIELQSYDDGTIATIFKARANNSELDHRFFYGRFDGSSWSYHYLGRAGEKLYSTEQDYVGLGAIHPSNPNIIYISTPFDPRDETNLGVHEIFKGVTNNQGNTWTWTPVTQNSVRDNLRPIVPRWNNNNTALLWWRGTYNTAQTYDAAVVGVLDRPSESFSLMEYVDASSSNTFLANGGTFSFSGPASGQGPADGQWHFRTDGGNGNSVFTSAENDSENAPVIKTQFSVPQAGTYDVWVNFWANPQYDWRIEAGLSQSNMQIFRQMASKQVEAGDHANPLILSGGGNTYLYQAYVGRVNAGTGNIIEVFIDDEAIATGSASTQAGDTVRTWYDGISYARLAGTGGGITVRARGTSGSEHINLIVGGSTVADWTLTTSHQNYTYSGSATGDIQVQFDNDGSGRDVVVDYIQVDGETRQAEAQSTNTGVWQDGACGGGGYSQWLHCNGYIDFGSTGASSSITIQENVTGFCSVDGTVDSNHSGFNGSGFANTYNASGNGVDWSVNVPADGNYSLEWRYANGGSTNRTGSVQINGTSLATVDFPVTGAWSNWTSASANIILSAGHNTIRLQATTSAGLGNIDSLTVTGNNPQPAACGSSG